MKTTLKSEKETVKELFKKGYEELYAVDVYTENEIAGTRQFYIYGTLEDAKKYIRSVVDYYKKTSYEFKKTETGFEYESGGHKMKTWFTIKRYYKRAA